MRYLLIVALTLTTGCGIFGCEQQTEFVDILFEPYGPGTTDLRLVRLEILQEDGWDCRVDGPIFALGQEVGETWRCTICD